MPRNILVHELNRVRTMTDDQLDVRYGKMTKEEKIAMFHEALKKEGRNPSLQNRIAKDQGWDNAPTHEPAIEEEYSSWVIRAMDRDHEYVFLVNPNGVSRGPDITLTEWTNGKKVHTSTIEMDAARKMWNEYVNDQGYREV